MSPCSFSHVSYGMSAFLESLQNILGIVFGQKFHLSYIVGVTAGEGLVEPGLDRHEQLKLEAQKQYLLGQGLPESHKGSACRHQDSPNAMDDEIDDEDLEDIE